MWTHFQMSFCYICVRTVKRSHQSNFQFCQSNSKLHRFYFATFRDRFRKPALPSQPIRRKTKTNCNLATRGFPHFSSVLGFAWISIGFLKYFPLVWLAVVITLVSVLRHPFGKHSASFLVEEIRTLNKSVLFLQRYVPSPIFFSSWPNFYSIFLIRSKGRAITSTVFTLRSWKNRVVEETWRRPSETRGQRVYSEKTSE